MITSNNGVLYDGNAVMDAPSADTAAHDAGFHFAEHLVVWLAGRQKCDVVFPQRVDAEVNGNLSSGTDHSAPWVSWVAGDGKVTLDGDFSIDELRAIAWWMKNYNQKAEAWYRAQKQS